MSVDEWGGRDPYKHGILQSCLSPFEFGAVMIVICIAMAETLGNMGLILRFFNRFKGLWQQINNEVSSLL